jgi:hypothetical protein
MEAPVSIVKLSFASGAMVSDIKFIGNKSIVAVRLPSTWPAHDVDELALYAGYSETDTPDPVYDSSGTAVTVPGVAAGAYVTFNQSLTGLLAVQVKTTKAQTAGNYVELICRDVA